MRSLLALWRLLRLALHVLHGLLVVHLLFGRMSAAQRQARIGWWSGRMLRLLGVTLSSQGQARPGPKLLVANHVSWLDIAAVHALLPEARFVSKADVRHWPLLGRMVEEAGTIFIERASKRDALRVVHQSAEALLAGDTVAVFPEGTTGPGPELLPFHANILQAAIATELPVQPLALRWHEPGQRFSLAARFIGDMSLAQSLWAVARARGLGVELRILPAQGTRHADRRALAAHLREEIAQALD